MTTAKEAAEKLSKMDDGGNFEERKTITPCPKSLVWARFIFGHFAELVFRTSFSRTLLSTSCQIPFERWNVVQGSDNCQSLISLFKDFRHLYDPGVVLMKQKPFPFLRMSLKRVLREDREGLWRSPVSAYGWAGFSGLGLAIRSGSRRRGCRNWIAAARPPPDKSRRRYTGS